MLSWPIAAIVSMNNEKEYNVPREQVYSQENKYTY